MPVEVVAHRNGDRIIVEFELVPAHPEDFRSASQLDTELAISRLRGAVTLEDAAAVAARETRALTGFDCVLVYRFDPDWNGAAIAEDKDPSWTRSLLGLHFPASDIPAQARALYTRAKSRFVIDRDYVPVPLVATPSTANAPVDLTFAQARSLSPIHLEYQRNLGVNGSMSISILVEGRLWGLMIGHHRRPHYVAPETRAAATVLADAFAMRVHELESRRLWQEQQAHLALESDLVRELARSDDFVSALTENAHTLLDLFEAGGAATVSDESVRCLGRARRPRRSWRSPPGCAPPCRRTAPATPRRNSPPPIRRARPSPNRPAGSSPCSSMPSGATCCCGSGPRCRAPSPGAAIRESPSSPAAARWRCCPGARSSAGSRSAAASRSPSPPGRSASPRPWPRRWKGVVLRQQRKITELTGLLADKERLLAQKDLLTARSTTGSRTRSRSSRPSSRCSAARSPTRPRRRPSPRPRPGDERGAGP